MFTISRDLAALLRRVEKLFEDNRPNQALNVLEEARRGLQGSDAVVSFIVAGDGFSSLGHWEDARKCYKEVLLRAKGLDLMEKKEKLRRLATSYFRALFFTVQEEQAFRVILAISQNAPFDRPFLLELARILQEQKNWLTEAQLWDIILLRSPKGDYPMALVGKGIALVRNRLISEGKKFFHRAARKRPDFFAPYQWLGGLYLVEGKDKAFYFLQKAWDLGCGERGSREPGFCRNVFIAGIIQADYARSEEALNFLSENPEHSCELVEVCLMNMVPSFLGLFMRNFARFVSLMREPKKRTPRKRLRLIDGIEKVLGVLDFKQKGLREYFFPLAKEYFWRIPVEDLGQLSYHACLEILWPYSEEEIEAFIKNYASAIDEKSYRSFVKLLKEQKVLVGFLLLTFSRFLNLLADVLEELDRALEGPVLFDAYQEEPYRYKKGRITFGSSGSFRIDDPEGFKEILRREIMEGP